MSLSPKAPAMGRMTVTMQPLPRETRLLVMAGRHEVMRAVLVPTTSSHPRAATKLLEGLEGLPPWHQQVLSVVLCADASVSSSATRMYDDLGFGVKTVHYEVEVEVEVAFRDPHRRGRRRAGFGNFADLRRLCLGVCLPRRPTCGSRPRAVREDAPSHE